MFSNVFNLFETTALSTMDQKRYQSLICLAFLTLISLVMKVTERHILATSFLYVAALYLGQNAMQYVKPSLKNTSFISFESHPACNLSQYYQTLT